MNTEQANQIPLQELLEQLGHHPVKQQGREFIYYSPFRQEKTPSFSLNPTKNFWYDFGIAQGGSVISFAKQYKGHDDTSKALAWVAQIHTPHQSLPQAPASWSIGNGPKLQLVEQKPLTSPALTAYLQERNISPQVAQQHLHEMHYRNTQTGRHFVALGFPNQVGGG